MQQVRPIVGCGSVVVDLFQSVKRFPVVGSKGYIHRDAPTPVRRAGGVCLNALAWAALLTNTPTSLLARLPPPETDQDSAILHTAMVKSRIDDSNVVRSSCYRTPFSYVFTTMRSGSSEPERTIIMDTADTGTICTDFILQNWTKILSESSVVVTEVSQLQLDAVQTILSLGRDAGAITYLDVDVAPQDADLGSITQMWDVLSHATVVKSSYTAAHTICKGLKSLESIHDVRSAFDAAQFLHRNLPIAPQLLIVTDGGNGSVGILDSGTFAIARPPCKNSCAHSDESITSDVVDVTGSGDAFTGGCLAWLYWSGSIPRSQGELSAMLKVANVCGTACSQVMHSALPPAFTNDYVDRLCSMDDAMYAFVNQHRRQSGIAGVSAMR